MNNDYKKQILSLLVDWYEASPAYVRNQRPSRRRNMRLFDNGQTDFASYDIENHVTRNDINQAVLDLANRGYIEYKWMQGQQNHIIAKLWLNFDMIAQVYTYLNRQPKGDEVDSLRLELMELQAKIKDEWASCWLEDTITAISRKRSIGVHLPENISECGELLKAISYLTNRTEIETLERIFSIQCFGDSKRFERSVKTRLVRILKKYLVKDDCEDDEALRLVGIVRYPEQFEFSGALLISLPDGALDFSPLPFGGTLTIEDVKQGKVMLKSNIRRILSIENRANYIEYVHKSQAKDEFVLFHGGHFSPAKRVFFRAIATAMPKSCEYYHWGDIDYGGFSMLARLRREIQSDIKAWRMNKEELSQYSRFTAGFSDSYCKRLTSLMAVPELKDCLPCLEFMLEAGVRLEQEAMLVQP